MISFGIIGTGWIASQFTKAAQGINETVLAVASRDYAKAQAFQAQFGLEKAYGSYHELFQDETIDVLYVATPHGLHFEQMMEALDYNKHILCEKAFTLNQQQALQVFLKAKATKRFVMEAMWTRFLPIIQEVKKLIDEDLIGDLIQLDATFTFPAPLEKKSRLMEPSLGGGALLDIGIYPITMANLFLGIPVSMESNVVIGSTGVDVASEITYFYPQAEANLKCSFQEERLIETIIYGTKGYIQIPNFNGAETAIVYDRNHKIVKELEHKHLVNGYEYEIFETVRMLKKKQLESPIMSHEMTLEILRQMDQLRRDWNLKYPQE